MKLLLWNCLCPMAYHDDTVFTDLSLTSLNPHEKGILICHISVHPCWVKSRPQK